VTDILYPTTGTHLYYYVLRVVFSALVAGLGIQLAVYFHFRAVYPFYTVYGIRHAVYSRIVYGIWYTLYSFELYTVYRIPYTQSYTESYTFTSRREHTVLLLGWMENLGRGSLR
jgi:hypothetical protein